MTDEPPFTFEKVIDMIWSFLAALGLIAASAIVGLYFSGFFHWLAKVKP